MNKLFACLALLVCGVAHADTEETYIQTFPDSLDVWSNSARSTPAGQQRILRLKRSTITLDQPVTLSSTLAVATTSVFTGVATFTVAPTFTAGLGSPALVAPTISGLTTATGGLTTTKPLFLHDRLRFCGNGSNGATAWYDGPVLESDGATDFSLGSAGCDGNDSGTEATADRPMDAYSAIKVVGMACVTQAGGAADTNTFQLRTATADVAGMTCAVTNDGAAAKQCSVILAAPVAIVVNATLAVKNTQSGTDDMSAKDMGCTVYYTY